MADMISRQAAIDSLNKRARETFTLADGYQFYLGALHDVADDIRGLPSAEVDEDTNVLSKWIPVSERLPEVNGRYLVTRGLNACGAMWNRVYIINYSDLMGLKSERIWWDGNVGKSDFERIDDVIAWMPLPEPYRKETEDDEIHQQC